MAGRTRHASKNTDNIVDIYPSMNSPVDSVDNVLQNPTIKTVPYTLKPEKALVSKLDACNRVNQLEIVYTEGGIRVFCQTALYEILRTQLLDFYNNHPKKSVTVTKSKSHNGAEVSEVVRVRIKRKMVYTINLYHTQSSLLINGIMEDLFVDEDLPDLQSKLRMSNPQLADLNSQIKSAIIHTLADCNLSPPDGRRQQHLGPATPNSAADGDLTSNLPQQRNGRQLVSTAAISEENGRQLVSIAANSEKNGRQVVSIAANAEENGDSKSYPLQRNRKRQLELPGATSAALSLVSDKSLSTQQLSNEKFLCNICHTPCESESVCCDIGNHWLHYGCEELSKDQIRELEHSHNDDAYDCKACCAMVTSSTPPVRAPVTSSTPPVRAPVTSSTPLVRAPVTSSTPPVRAPVTSSTPPVHAPVTSSTPPVRAPVTSSTPPVRAQVTPSTPPVRTLVTSSTPPVSSPQFQDWEKELKQKEKQLNAREKRVKFQEAEVKEQSRQISSLQALVFKLENDVKTLRRDNHLSRLSHEEESSQHNPCKEQPHVHSTHAQCVGLPTLSAIEGMMGKLTGLVSDMTTQILKQDKQRWYSRRHQSREYPSHRDSHIIYDRRRDPYVHTERQPTRSYPYVYTDDHQHHYSRGYGHRNYYDNHPYHDPRQSQRHEYNHREVIEYNHTCRAAVHSDIAGEIPAEYDHTSRAAIYSDIVGEIPAVHSDIAGEIPAEYDHASRAPVYTDIVGEIPAVHSDIAGEIPAEYDHTSRAATYNDIVGEIPVDHSDIACEIPDSNFLTPRPRWKLKT
jgi:hypothetical protein